RLELVEQRVVLVVGDLGVVEDVVAVDVVVEDTLELLRALRRRRWGHSAGSGVESKKRERSCSTSAWRPSWWGRSKWIGVTEMWRAAIAARSVPGSSWKSGSSPYTQYMWRPCSSVSVCLSSSW